MLSETNIVRCQMVNHKPILRDIIKGFEKHFLIKELCEMTMT